MVMLFVPSLRSTAIAPKATGDAQGQSGCCGFRGESLVITEDAIEVPASSKIILAVDYMLRAGCQMSIENA